MSLLETLLKSMTNDAALDSMSRRSGGNSDQMATLVTAALPVLLQALTANASSKSGAASLQEALSQHMETGTVAQQVESADLADGAKILQHILGGNQASVMNNLSQESGLNQAQVGSALGALAPVLLSSLSAASQRTPSAPAQPRKPAIDLSDGIDASDVLGFMQMMSSARGSAQAAPQQQQQSAFDGSDLLGLLSLLK